MARNPLIDDDLNEHLAGRLEENDDASRVFNRLFTRGSHRTWQRLTSGRAASALGGGKPQRPVSVVVKQISGLRDRAGVTRLIRYIARLNEEKKEPGGKDKPNRTYRTRHDLQPIIRDGQSNRIPREQVIERILHDWRLTEHDRRRADNGHS